MKTSFLATISVCVLFFLAGRLPAENPNAAATAVAPSSSPATDTGLSVSERERLEVAELARKKWMDYLQNAQSVNDMIQAKEELDKINLEIREIREGKPLTKEERQHKFKNVEERKIVYGPIGIVLELTEWILRKLYLWSSD